MTSPAGAWRGTSARASRSSVGRSSGANIGTARSSSTASSVDDVARVEPDQPAPEQRREQGQDDPARHERAADAERGDKERGEQRAQPDRADEDALEQAEHPRQHLVGDRPLQQRDRGEVDDRHAGSEHGEQQRASAAVPGIAATRMIGAPQSTSPSPKSEAIRRRPSSAAATQRADDPARADRAVEDPDPRVAEIEQLQRGDDDEHVQRARDEVLGAVEPDDEPKPRIGVDRADARERVGESVADARARRRRLPGSGCARSGRSRARSAPAVASSTDPALQNESSTPLRSGPSSIPELSIVVSVRFAAVSSLGVSARNGSAAVCSGLTIVESSDSRPTRTKTGASPPPLRSTKPGAADRAGAHAPGDEEQAVAGKRPRSPAASGPASAAEGCGRRRAARPPRRRRACRRRRQARPSSPSGRSPRRAARPRPASGGCCATRARTRPMPHGRAPAPAPPRRAYASGSPARWLQNGHG